MRLNKAILSVLLLSILWSCTQNGSGAKPENLIDEDTMVQILYDATQLEVMKSFPDKNPEFEAIFGRPYIYLKYGVDSLQLLESEAYYLKNPRIYYKIHLRVLLLLEQRKDSFDGKFKGQKAN